MVAYGTVRCSCVKKKAENLGYLISEMTASVMNNLLFFSPVVSDARITSPIT